MSTSEEKQISSLCFTEAGQYHAENGMECQDVCFTREEKEFAFFGLADGQSGRLHCAEGGRAVLAAVAEYLYKKGILNIANYQYTDELQYEIIRVIRGTLAALAQEHGCGQSEFSSTIAVFAIDPESGQYITIHLGDGAIIGVTKESEAVMMSGPENGITRQYTWLTSSIDALQHIRIHTGSAKELGRIVLLTDGATMLCRGNRIAKRTEEILCDLDCIQGISDEIRRVSHWDDAGCITVDL